MNTLAFLQYIFHDYWVVLFTMIFLHIVDDFKHQDILAEMKEKKWWEKLDGYSDYYRYDYIVALIVHSFSWTFVVMLPLLILSSFEINWGLALMFIIHAVTHSMTDDLKANQRRINLVIDQFVHLLQIFVMSLYFFYI